ncbi:MAG: pirin family protein [Cytophagaceae bacterium]|nr:pirin family protein [Cytophagaceae bacterium]MDW8457303.1 pirin family protein [Cytophagaceae bacterium]
MKKEIHRAGTRGYAHHGWLETYHSFSFADYYNPERMNFGALRVLNDDLVQAGMGFGTHPHSNMEIVSIPLKGSLEHRDTTGAHTIIHVNDVQIMSAGTGVHHSEYNHSKTEEVNFLQIWITPKERNITPRYDQKTFSQEGRKNKFQLLVSPEKNNESVWINQDAYLWMADLDANNNLNYVLQKKTNGIYLFVIEGELMVEGETLRKRDAIAISEYDQALSVKAEKHSKILLIEVPMVSVR